MVDHCHSLQRLIKHTLFRSAYKATLLSHQRSGSTISTVLMLFSAYATSLSDISNYRRKIVQMIREEGVSSLGRGIGPNVFRAILMNASQLAPYVPISRLSLTTDASQVRLHQGRTA
jgi:Mitochondrial carrier protein